MGIVREWQLLEGEAHLAIRSDRRDHLPYGLYGGKPASGSINVLRHSEEEEVLPTMISTTMKAGEVIYHRQAGGGGWGDPLERNPKAVAKDVKNGRVSVGKAREAYGVVLEADTFEVNLDRTRELRREMRDASAGIKGDR
jgi:N-methylhydantoinase B